MSDEICIEELELAVCIGTTDEERGTAQRMTVSLRIEPVRAFSEVGDQIARAVDYAAVCEAVRELAGSGRWNLVETVAEEVAALVLSRFDVARVEVELRKFVLPDTRHVAVRITRPARG